MPDSATSIGAITYAVGTAAFLLFAVPLLINWKGRVQGTLLLVACAITVAWTTATAVHYWAVTVPPGVTATLEVSRSLGWIAFLGSILYPERSSKAWFWRARYMAPLAILAVAVIVGFSVLMSGAAYTVSIHPRSLIGLALAVAGILLTETVYRNTPPDQRWHIKFLCLSTGAIFAYDLFLYADATLFGQVDQVLQEARGGVQAVVVPMLVVAAARNKMWKINVSISREVALRSTTFVASGLYLFLMAVLGFFLREIDEVRGPAIQVIFFVGALAVLFIVLFSGTYRAYLKVFVSKHFYEQKYDWREEWLRFMRTLSTDPLATPLEERAVRAIADIVESPGGAMWLLEANRYEPACSWNFAVPGFAEETGGSLARFLTRAQWVVDLDEAAARPDAFEGLVVPDALRSSERAWLIVPLWHRSLMGFIVLARPRAPRPLGWEDYDLLKTVGRQAVSYLAEQKAAQALDEAREFEIFNRSFAFVIHDIKNLVSQLSLIVRNFEKHSDNKAFRDDMAETLNDTVTRMKRLMQRIDSHRAEPSRTNVAPLAPLIRKIVAEKKEASARLVFDCEAPDTVVAADRDRLEAVVAHLIQNAIDVVGEDGYVRVGLKRNGRSAVIDIVDDGPGMDSDFIRNELFKPFRSTKDGGMGIGAYQCREYARELGGNLDAISTPGRGTTMRMTLPVATAAQRLEAAPASSDPL
jgi:putative PEP-CTERM system histidine kinase